jgi:hypothetical protein
MTIAGLSSDQFLSILKANGYEVLSSEYWEKKEVERITIGKDGHTFAFRVNHFYNPSEVIKRMDMLGVDTIPEEFEVEYTACVKEYERKQKSIQRINEESQKASIAKPDDPPIED